MAKARKGSMTIDEFHAQLKAEGKYEEMMALKKKREEERLRRVAELHQAQAPVAAELRRAGFDIQSVGELSSYGVPFPEVIPILIEHLQRDYPPDVLDLILSTLSVPEAKYAWETFVQLYRQEDSRSLKGSLANVINDLADDDLIDEVIALVRDPGNGSTRLLLLRALERSQAPRAHATLEEMADDPDLVKEIAVILRRIKKRRAKISSRLKPASQAPPSGSAEASAGFDLDDVRPFLDKVRRKVKGMGKREINHLMARLQSLEPDEEETWCLPVVFRGREVELQIHLFMDDSDAPDLYFFTEPELAGVITELIASQE